MTEGCGYVGVTMWVLTEGCGHVGVSMQLTSLEEVSKSAVAGLFVLAGIQEVLVDGKLNRE